MWVWLDKITPYWVLEYRDSLAQPNVIPTTAVSYVQLDMPLEGICLCDRSPQQIACACNTLPTMEFKSAGTLMNNKLRASFQTNVSRAFYQTLQTSKMNVKMKKSACPWHHSRGTKKKSESPTGFEPMTSQTPGGRSIHLSYATLQVKVFARAPFGNQLFWFRETFLQIKSPAAKF